MLQCLFFICSDEHPLVIYQPVRLPNLNQVLVVGFPSLSLTLSDRCDDAGDTANRVGGIGQLRSIR